MMSDSPTANLVKYIQSTGSKSVCPDSLFPEECFELTLRSNESFWVHFEQKNKSFTVKPVCICRQDSYDNQHTQSEILKILTSKVEDWFTNPSKKSKALALYDIPYGSEVLFCEGFEIVPYPSLRVCGCETTKRFSIVLINNIKRFMNAEIDEDLLRRSLSYNQIENNKADIYVKIASKKRKSLLSVQASDEITASLFSNGFVANNLKAIDKKSKSNTETSSHCKAKPKSENASVASQYDRSRYLEPPSFPRHFNARIVNALQKFATNQIEEDSVRKMAKNYGVVKAEIDKEIDRANKFLHTHFSEDIARKKHRELEAKIKNIKESTVKDKSSPLKPLAAKSEMPEQYSLYTINPITGETVRKDPMLIEYERRKREGMMTQETFDIKMKLYIKQIENTAVQVRMKVERLERCQGELQYFTKKAGRLMKPFKRRKHYMIREAKYRFDRNELALETLFFIYEQYGEKLEIELPMMWEKSSTVNHEAATASLLISPKSVNKKAQIQGIKSVTKQEDYQKVDDARLQYGPLLNNHSSDDEYIEDEIELSLADWKQFSCAVTEYIESASM